ncbi:G protein-coupled glucose receptor regulating Gpa2-domain-containing protein [Hypoxylon trugodes]|uniref:G protein-coupled glucose receptor regulating Gpa2-domain-containing protein n=1 Tax=Hypoxylon trugodes TaxID=326681 RepID=UPI00218D2A16|nr:G protein-coupled glucose receptor regulating Gpa2-domain-containing protein [Hypoxylon trugodes]KAI1386083.1 G protein-coupled glucose receptor regulating Gpa2-domain-containing protein [Hypoxylon trugodes]
MAPLTWLSGVSLTEYLMPNTANIINRDTTQDVNLNDPELIALMSISLSTASISVLAALCAFYWFVRMRRSFRHDLIMLLIQSDMMKALWLVINPLAFFAGVPIDSNSVFCQVSGFFLTISIEASDIAVLLVAAHTALFILWPSSSSGADAGLYPYRYIAYTFWAIVPIILAAVVPITGGRFSDNGPHCSLPGRPAWYLSALSWIPRYIIFAIIIVTYTFLYIYVACRFRRFGRDQRRASVAHSNHPDHNRKNNHRHSRSREVPPTPPISDYGMLDSARDSLAKEEDPRDRQNSVSSTISTLNTGEGSSTPPRKPEHARRSSIKWNPVNFAGNNPRKPGMRRESESALIVPISPSLGAERTIPICAPEPTHNSPRNSQQSGQNQPVWQRSMSLGSHGKTGSVSGVVNALRRGPPRKKGESQSTFSSSALLSQEETEEAMRRSREKQQRQLRLLFVYPAIYLLTWIAPFVSHVMGYDSDIAPNGQSGSGEPLALQVVSIASLCIGAAVDCCFFSAWEKPWLHLRGGFWEGLALRLRIHRPMRRRHRGAGRTRQEMFVDARTARVRRDQEENLENLSSEVGRGVSGRGTLHNTVPREWWDVLDVDSETSTIRTA